MILTEKALEFVKRWLACKNAWDRYCKHTTRKNYDLYLETYTTENKFSNPSEGIDWQRSVYCLRDLDTMWEDMEYKMKQLIFNLTLENAVIAWEAKWAYDYFRDKELMEIADNHKAKVCPECGGGLPVCAVCGKPEGPACEDCSKIDVVE